MMKKSTRERIIDQAIADASLVGLKALTIGTLASELRMSKSGVFAHFGSKDALQLEVIKEIFEAFTNEVISPALASPSGTAQLRALFENWINWSIDERRPGGCPIVGAVFDIDGQPGPVRDAVAEGFRRWIAILRFVITKAQSVDLSEAMDADQLIWQMFGLYFSHHVFRHFMDDSLASAQAITQFQNILLVPKEDAGCNPQHGL